MKLTSYIILDFFIKKKKSYQWLVGWPLPSLSIIGQSINDTTGLLASVKQYYGHNGHTRHVYLCSDINI